MAINKPPITGDNNTDAWAYETTQRLQDVDSVTAAINLKDFTIDQDENGGFNIVKEGTTLFTIDANGNITITGDITANGNISLTGDVNASTLDTLDSTQFLRSDANDTMSAGSSTQLNITHSDNAGQAEIALYGPNQGTGRVYVGQSSTYGGGIEYNGDAAPATSGGSADRITLFRRSAGTDLWTAQNTYSDNNWWFRGNLYMNSTSSGSGNLVATTSKEAIGSYTLGYVNGPSNLGPSDINFGSTLSGSFIRAANIRLNAESTTAFTAFDGAAGGINAVCYVGNDPLSGTWRVMGTLNRGDNSTANYGRFTLFARIS